MDRPSREGRRHKTGIATVPNFKRFRKNYVAIPDEYVVVGVDTTSQKKKDESDRHQQMTKQERELAEDQRLADELFRGVEGRGAGGTKRRRRA